MELVRSRETASSSTSLVAGVVALAVLITALLVVGGPGTSPRASASSAFPLAVVSALSRDGAVMTAPWTNAAITAPAAVATVKAGGERLSTVTPVLESVSFNSFPVLNANGPVLCWAVLVMPGPVSSGPMGNRGPVTVHENFRADFVNAQTGTWLLGIQTYANGVNLTRAP
jgi:hypothetical protein